ncbi:MAG: cell division/cell wall cluster transcriptional repressor MraZ [Candidatus Muiribacterium halophilum]|uniref:Transcriptional regulator MraZ n=1 Tax=Muiribacterium halophilum TaxID=2053465 RepID=A0A2N5ZJU4_MUIH1|nr:MAG: cell division/cell wall cluster transcriptional repressor MraZ [Candidatus Muirbacterium halophilum]
MFLGEYKHTLDKKGRVIIPSRFRQELGDTFIITCGFEKCLTIYPMDKWEEISDKISNLPFVDRNVRSFIRLIYSKAVEVSLDKLGRIVVPQNLREYASLDKDAVINGILDNIEVWDKQTWEEYSNKASDDFEDQAQKLTDIF